MNSLVEIGKQYTSEDAFKIGNYPKYLIAKRKGLMPQIFPKIKSNLPEPYKGIYFLYQHLKTVYIGYSLVDGIAAVNAHKEESTIKFNNYKFFRMSSEADIIVLSTYFANLYKPQYNTNIGVSRLSFTIPYAVAMMGPAIKSKI